MLTGRDLGDAIRSAIKKKGVTQREVARVFEVQPPSVQDWMKRGTVAKDKLPALWHYFEDVVGPDHWGLDSFPRWPSRPRTTPISLGARPDAAAAHGLVQQLDQAVQALSAESLDELRGLMDLYLKKPAVYRHLAQDIERVLLGELPPKTGTHDP